MMLMSDELLTVAQTAARLSISERTLRRALRLPELQVKLVAISRHIGGREREVSLVNTALYEELCQKFYGYGQQASHQASAGNSPAALTGLYERLLEAKDQQIADLQAALQNERLQSERLRRAVEDVRQELAVSQAEPETSMLARLFGRSRNPKTRRIRS